MSLPELVVALALGVVLLFAGTIVSVPWLAREASRGALHDARVLLQTARMEAVRRNHACSFEIDLASRTMAVVDMNGTSTTTDDPRAAVLKSVALSNVRYWRAAGSLGLASANAR